MPRKSKSKNSRELYGQYSSEVNDEQTSSDSGMDSKWEEFKKKGISRSKSGLIDMQSKLNADNNENKALTNKISAGGTLTPEEEIRYAVSNVHAANNKYKGLQELSKQYRDAYQESVDSGITMNMAPMAGGMGMPMGAMGNYSQLNAAKKSDSAANKMKDIEKQIKELTGFSDEGLAHYLEDNKRIHNAQKTDEMNSLLEIDKNDSVGKKASKGLFNELMSLGASYTPLVGNMASAIGKTESNRYKPNGYGEDVNSQYKGISNASNYAQEQIQNSIDNPLGKFAQSVAHSTLDSVVRTAPTMMVNAMTGGVASKALEAGTLLSYYQSSRDSAYQEARERGYSEDHAQLIGKIGGAAEAALEMIPTGHILNNAIGKNAGKSAFLNILKGMNEEGLEELGTDVVNDLADYFFSSRDQFGESEFNQIRSAYISAGMDEEAATKKAILDKVSQYGQDYAAGAFSGGFMQGTSTAIGVATYGADENKIRQNAQYTIDNINGDTEYDNDRKRQAEKYMVVYYSDIYDFFTRNAAEYINDKYFPDFLSGLRNQTMSYSELRFSIMRSRFLEKINQR